MQSPAWQVLKQHHPDWQITLWVAPRGTKALAEADPAIDHVIEAPIKASLLQHFKMLQRLRAQKFDLGIVMAPGQLVKSAAYLYLAGIPQRIGHHYPLGNHSASSFLLTNAIPQQNFHDIEQNLNLLTLLGITPSSPPSYILMIPTPAQERAATLLRSLAIPAEKTIIGLHPGSARDFTWKRWPLENFVVIAQRLIKEHNAHILIFGGSDEEQLKKEIALHIKSLSHPAHLPDEALAKTGGGAGGSGSPVTIISTDLLTTAALMQHCRLVITNDSGLMHLAAAAGAPTLGLFGPTDERRIGPRGLKSFTIRAPDTKPVYDVNTNFHLGSAAHRTLGTLKPELVSEKINDILL